MLEYVKIKKCPICGCEEIVREEISTMNGKISYHCNGERWETRAFARGYSVRYVPNFRAEEVISKCNKIREQEIKECNNAINELLFYLNSTNYSDKTKINLREILNRGRKYH